MSDDRVVPKDPLSNPTEGDYGGNEGDVTEEDYEEIEKMDEKLNNEGQAKE